LKNIVFYDFSGNFSLFHSMYKQIRNQSFQLYNFFLDHFFQQKIQNLFSDLCSTNSSNIFQLTLCWENSKHVFFVSYSFFFFASLQPLSNLQTKNSFPKRQLFHWPLFLERFKNLFSDLCSTNSPPQTLHRLAPNSWNFFQATAFCNSTTF